MNKYYYNFIKYLLDNHLLEPIFTWKNVKEITPPFIKLMANLYYENYKRYCIINSIPYKDIR